jgi:cold shock CspA family protein
MSEESRERVIGKLRFWNSAKGFGFVAPEEGGGKIFVHANSLQHAGISDPQPGMRVEFKIVPDNRDPRRLRAIDLLD